MKRFRKICLVLILVFILLGAAVMGIGVAIGGTSVANAGFKKAFAKHSGWFLRWENWCDDYFDDEHWVDWDDDDDADDHTDSANIKSEHFDLRKASLEELKVDVDAAKIYFKTSKDVSEATIDIDSHKKNRISVDNDNNGHINIHTTDEHHSHTHLAQIIITLPLDYVIDDLSVDLGAGEIIASDDLHANELSLDMGSGNIQLATLNANDIEINNAAGNVNLTLAGNEKDYNYKLSCALGQVLLDDQSDAGFGNDFNRDYNANKDVCIDVATGNIEVHFSK